MTASQPQKETSAAITHYWLNGYILSNQICLILDCWELMRKRVFPCRNTHSLGSQTVMKSWLQSNREWTVEDTWNSCLQLFWKHFSSWCWRRRVSRVFFPLIMERIHSLLWIFAHREIKGCYAQEIRTKERLLKCQFVLLGVKQIWHKHSPIKEIFETTHLVTCFWNHEPQAEAWCVFEKRLHSCLSQTLLQFSVGSKHFFWISVLSNFQSDHK